MPKKGKYCFNDPNVRCKEYINTNCVNYTGANLPYIQVTTGETLTEILQGLNDLFSDGITSVDEQVKVSSNDSLAGYLIDKLIEGTGISFTENNDGFIETLEIINTAPDQVVTLTEGSNITITGTYPNFTIAASGGVITDELVKVSANDTTSGYLNGKLISGTGITLTENNNGGNETLSVINTAPDQTVVLNNGTGISVTGTYPNFTITSTITQYTDELAQDAIGAMIDSTLTYVDGTPLLQVTPNTTVQKVEVVKNSGAVVGTRKQLNFIEGSNITLTIADDGGNDQVDITIASSGGASGYATIQEEGSSLTQRPTMNFIGGGVTAADDAGNSRTNITLDSTLNSLAAYNTNGLLTQTSADTFTGRTITPGTGISVADGDGVAGNPTITNTDLGSSQNIFKNIAVSGQNTVVADSNNDTLTLVAGTNITITTDDTTDSITINSTGGGSGTVNTGVQYKAAYYASAGTAVDDWAGVNFGQTNLNTQIVQQATGAVALEIKGIAAQTGNFLNISSSSGTADLGSIDKDGYLTIKRVGIGTSPSGAALKVQGTGAGANWAEFSNNVGGSNPSNDAGVKIGWNLSNSNQEAIIAYHTTGGDGRDLQIGEWNSTSSTFKKRIEFDAATNKSATIYTHAVGEIHLELKGIASQTGNFLEVNSSSGSGGNLVKITKDGYGWFPAGSASANAQGLKVGGTGLFEVVNNLGIYGASTGYNAFIGGGGVGLKSTTGTFDIGQQSTFGTVNQIRMSTTAEGAVRFSTIASTAAVSLTVLAGEGTDATLRLSADEADDTADSWDITAQASDNDLVFKNGVTENFRLLQNGRVQIQNITQDDTETKLVVWNSTDKVLEWRDASTISGGGYTDEQAQDSVGNFSVDTDTINFTYTDATPEFKWDVRTQMSITSDSSGIKLVNDETTPTDGKFYGKSGGNKGWFTPDTGKRFATITIGAFDALDTTTTHYDYVCDGTADDVQILAAIAALPSTGGRIILSEGTFNIAAAIVIDNDNVTLEGQGQGTKIFLSNATNTDVITVGNGATAYVNITIKNLSIDGNKANQTTGGRGVFISQGAARTIIENCRISNTFSDSIEDNGSVGARISSNVLESPGATSYNIEFTGTEAVIHGNICSGGTTACILTDGSPHPSNVTISNNICKPGSTADGIILGAWQVVCVGNTISDFGGVGISSNVPCEIAGNVIEQRNGTGTWYIYISSSDPSLVTGNTIFGYDNVTAACIGIYVDGAKSTTVSGNNIQFESTTTPAHVGIRIAAALVNCTGNVITQYQYTGTGIQRNGTQERGVISGNTITGFDIGIDITNTNYFTVIGNVLEINAGIIATNASNAVISNNNLVAVGGTRIGISLQNTSLETVIITGNNLIGFTDNGMSLVKITKSTISNNTLAGCGTTQAILIDGDSTYNTFIGNTIGKASGTTTYGIREDSSLDGPNTYVGNIVLQWATAAISTQHTGSQLGLNITS